MPTPVPLQLATNDPQELVMLVLDQAVEQFKENTEGPNSALDRGKLIGLQMALEQMLSFEEENAELVIIKAAALDEAPEE